MSVVDIKRGAALSLMLTFTDDNGVPVNLGACALSSQVRTTAHDLVATLPVTVTATAGVATVLVPDTTQWPLGTLLCDVRLVTNGLPVLSETFGIRVNGQVTR